MRATPSTFTSTIDLEVVFRTICKELSVDSFTVEYCLSRFRNEGLGFFTVTLPKLGKAVLHGIEVGYFDRTTVTCFAWKSRSLRYFRSLLCQIFGADGKLLDSPAPDAIWAIRQITEYFYKLCMEFSEDQQRAAEEKYQEIEDSLSAPVDWDFIDLVRKNIEQHYELPQSYDTVLAVTRPRHGPGSFSDDLVPRSLRRTTHFAQIKVHPRFSRSVPTQYRAISGYFKPYPSAPITISPTGSDTGRDARVLFVPKDSRGPRVISKEPMYLLKLQMAYFDFMSRHLEKVTGYRINFQDQGVNRRLAREGSIDGSYSTFDLSDASDRLRLDVVKVLFANSPGVRWFLKQRSEHAVLPTGKRIRMRKLSGMGSGLTFATMALVIHASIATKASRCMGIPFDEASKMVYVYGDDIIVPKRLSKYVDPAMQAVGLKVNIDKSYYRCLSKFLFRESCGGDYIAGQDVSIVRLRLSSAQLSAFGSSLTVSGDAGVFQLHAHAQELYLNGFTRLADYYWTVIERSLGVTLPKAISPQDVIVRLDRSASYKPDPTGKYPVIRAYRLVGLSRESKVDPYHLIGRCLSRSNGDFDFMGNALSIDQTRVDIPRVSALRKRRVSTIKFV